MSSKPATADARFRRMLFRPSVLGQLHRLSVHVLSSELRSESVDDLVQSALLTAWEKRGGFRGSTEPEFVAWYLRILKNKAVDEARRRGRSPLLLDEEALAEIPDEATSEVAAGRDPEGLERGLGHLPPVERAVVELVFRYGFTSHDAARVLGMELPALRMAQMRAIRKLRRLVSQS